MTTMELSQLSNEKLLEMHQKQKKSKLWNAVFIGFLFGILLFGFGAWILNPDRKIGFLIPMLFPIIFIYRAFKKPNEYKDLQEVLKERGLQ